MLVRGAAFALTAPASWLSSMAIRLASSRVSRLAATRRPGSL